MRRRQLALFCTSLHPLETPRYCSPCEKGKRTRAKTRRIMADPYIVRLMVDGRCSERVNMHEMWAAIDILVDRKMTQTAIAEVLGCSARTVGRRVKRRRAMTRGDQ